MASGLVNSLKNQWPECKIDWLVEPVGLELLAGHKDLEQVLEVPRPRWKLLRKQHQWLRLLKEVIDFRKTIRRHHYDLVLDVQGLLKSGVWAFCARATRKIGLGSKEGSQFFFDDVVERAPSPVMASEYRSLATKLGCLDSHYHMAIANSEKDRLAVTQLLQLENMTEFAVFCVFTTRPQKHWVTSYWQELAKQVQLHFGLPCLIVGGSSDAQQSQVIAMGDNLLSITGRTSLTETAELVKRARFLVGVDTGVTHMGIMNAIPTVCLFGSTVPYLEAQSAKILYRNASCSPCRRKPNCGGRFHCMSDITPAQVIEAIRALLSDEHNASG